MLTVIVHREENILAREKKALSKANRVRAPKLSLPKLTIPAAIPKTKRKGTSRKQSLIESIIIASPLRAESHDEQLDGDALAAAEAAATTFSRDIAASSHMDSQYSRQGGGDISGMSTPAAYFDYSSSTSSLPSERDHGHSGYSPALTYTSPQYYKDEVDYDFRYGPRATLDFQSYPVHHARHSHYIDYHDDDDVLRTPDYVQSIDSDQPRVAYPASVAADGPSGLCMYLPAPSTPYAMAQTMSRSSPSYNTGIHYSPAYDWSHSPKIYQGPIDWSARPLVPFSHPPSIPQTVRMDEICRVPL